MTLPEGSTIGILGSGQLGRMMALAAAPLGYRVHVYADEPGCAGDVAAAMTVAPWDDVQALQRFAEAVDVVTLEFENVPVSAVQHIHRVTPVHPGANVLRVCQDRVLEKQFIGDAGVRTTAWRAVHNADEVAAAVKDLGPCVLKTARAGYDGKGQARVLTAADAHQAWTRTGLERHPASPAPAIVEAFVDFAAEASVIVARNTHGEVADFELVENVHRDHILWQTHAPGRFSPATAARARDIARTLIADLEVVGLLAVELFILRDGDVLVNELAPRPHNSGHWTIDAAWTSQFEQAIRAVVGAPLGDPRRHHDAVMTNLIGPDIALAESALADPNTRVHRYAKGEARPGRKMGHLTRLGAGAAHSSVAG